MTPATAATESALSFYPCKMFLVHVDSMAGPISFGGPPMTRQCVEKTALMLLLLLNLLWSFLSDRSPVNSL